MSQEWIHRNKHLTTWLVLMMTIYVSHGVITLTSERHKPISAFRFFSTHFSISRLFKTTWRIYFIFCFHGRLVANVFEMASKQRRNKLKVRNRGSSVWEGIPNKYWKETGFPSCPTPHISMDELLWILQKCSTQTMWLQLVNAVNGAPA